MDSHRLRLDDRTSNNPSHKSKNDFYECPVKLSNIRVSVHVVVIAIIWKVGPCLKAFSAIGDPGMRQ